MRRENWSSHRIPGHHTSSSFSIDIHVWNPGMFRVYKEGNWKRRQDLAAGKRYEYYARQTFRPNRHNHGQKMAIAGFHRSVAKVTDRHKTRRQHWAPSRYPVSYECSCFREKGPYTAYKNNTGQSQLGSQSSVRTSTVKRNNKSMGSRRTALPTDNSIFPIKVLTKPTRQSTHDFPSFHPSDYKYFEPVKRIRFFIT